MAKDRGILLNPETGDLLINVKRDSNGKITQGLIVGNTLRQNQYIIMKAQPGEIKEHPTLGVGIDDMQNDEQPVTYWRRRIIEQFDRDSLIVESIQIDTNLNIRVNANYGA